MHKNLNRPLVPEEVSTKNWLLDICHYKRPCGGSAQANIQINSTVAIRMHCSAIAVTSIVVVGPALCEHAEAG